MKSSKNNRIMVIQEAIKDAHNYAIEHCGLPLNKMPEYFLGVAIGQKMVSAFDNFNVRFEMSVQQLMEHAGIQLSGDKANRENGRFDLVLLTKRGETPAHIIEIKRGVKIDSMLSDIKRLANICRYVQADTRLETNYFVTVTARSHELVLKRIEILEQKSIDNRGLENITINTPILVELGEFNDKPIVAAIYEITYRYD